MAFYCGGSASDPSYWSASTAWAGTGAAQMAAQQQMDLAMIQHQAAQQQAQYNSLANMLGSARPGGITRLEEQEVPKQPAPTIKPKQEKHSMFSEIAKDIKTFILEHRAVIYFLALALIVDHLIFKDVFRVRLQNIVEGIIKKVENKVNA